MRNLPKRTKYIIGFIIIFILLVSSICFRFIGAYQSIMSNSIDDIRMRTNYATQHMEHLLDPNLPIENRMISCESLINYTSFIKDRLACIYLIYFNDNPSENLARYFQEDISGFRDFLDKNREDIISFGLTENNMEILEDYSKKLTELNLKIDELAQYTNTDKQINLISSLIVPQTEFKRTLAESMITFFELETKN